MKKVQKIVPLALLTTLVIVITSTSFAKNLNRFNGHRKGKDLTFDIEALVSTMTLEQKVGQMTMAEIQHISPSEVRQYHIGAVLNGGGSFPDENKYASVDDWVMKNDAYWAASMDTGDNGEYLPIPVIWGTDAVHGHNNVMGATLFPHNIGLGAARSPGLIKSIAKITAIEVAATGLDWVFGPTLAVVRDDRWGRTYEGYSEDPVIVKLYAKQIVEGLQGKFGPSGVIATAKHYIGDGGTDQGVDQGDTILSEEELREIHLPGYLSAMKAGVQTIMVSFNSWNGEKMHGHKYLLTDVLKNELGFEGFLISDWNGIGQVEGCTNSSCAKAVNAGVDMFMVPYASDWKAFITNTINQVKNGDIPIERIDDAVTRILRVKMKAGLFTKPRPADRMLAGESSLVGNYFHRKVARRAVRKSLVLLKNNNSFLPLNRHDNILVAGKSADSISNQTGGWTLTWQGTNNTNDDFPGATSIWAGIKDVAPNAVLSADLKGSEADPNLHDLAIVVIGETPYAEGIGDIRSRQTLEHAKLHPEDLEVLQNISNAGVPIVTVFVTGRPLYVNKELNLSKAFVVAWLPGTEGAGVADVLFKKFNGFIRHDFKGKLSFSWPKEACQTPVNVHDEEYDPLFPYDYGLTYSDNVEIGALPEESPEFGCGQDPFPGEPATDPLPIFDRIAIDPWKLFIGDPSNWGGVEVVGDQSVSLQNVAVSSVDDKNGIQFAAKKVTFTGMGQIYAQGGGSSGIDLTSYLAANGTLNFDLKVNTPPAGNVTVRIDCVYPCIGEVNFTEQVINMANGNWHDVSIPLTDFADAGTDFTKVNTPFLLFTDGVLEIETANIRFEP